MGTTIEKLKEYNCLYRNGTPIIPDTYYDQVYKEVKEKYPNDPFFGTVQGLTDSFNKKTNLDYVLGSLRNFHCYPGGRVEGYKSGDDIETFLRKYNDESGWVLMDKIDGLSVLVTWIDGDILKAELRGEDGVIGCDVTDKVKIILNNKKINGHKKLVLRGEIVLSGDDPTSIGYKNRRNGAVGILKRENLKHIEHLSIYFYEMVDIESDLLNGTLTMAESLQLIAGLGLNIVRFEYIVNSKIEDISEFIHRRLSSGGYYIPGYYDIDGKVICTDSYKREDVKLPLGKVAIKGETQLMETIVRKIEYNTSRNGYAIPRIEYDPVDYNGATLSSATAFNYGFVVENRLGVGSKILITRAQEVVPKVETILESVGFEELDNCPSCGYELQWDKNKVQLVCNNTINCPAQVLKNITHFFITLGLEEFGETQISKLDVNSIFDVYKLTVKDVLSIDGFGDKSSEDLVKRIQETKNVKPAKLLQALGIPLLGKTLSKLLVQNYTWDEIVNVAFSNADLTKLDGVSDTKAEAVVQGLIKNSHMLSELFEIGVTLDMVSTGSLMGKTFCITGKLSAPRKTIEKRIADNGGETGSIKNIPGMYLVCNEKSSSSKYKKAEKLDIPIITEEQLFDMC